jgi:oligopeptide transport system permease protein
MTESQFVDINNLPENIRNLPDSSFEPALEREVGNEKFETKPIGYYKDALIRLNKNKVSVVSLWVIVLIIFMAIFAPYFNKYTYVQQNVDLRNMPPRIPGLEKLGIADGRKLIQNRQLSSVQDPELFPPESIIQIRNERMVAGVPVVDVLVNYYLYMGVDDVYYWFGSDYIGRDLFTRLFRGARISLLIAFLSVLTNVVIGIIYGSIAGYYGGKVDMFMMRFVEVLDGLPYLVVVMLFMMFLGTGILSLIIALTIMGWIGTARLIRAQFYRFKGREYVLAARTLGVPDSILIFRHILPNSLGPIITRTMIAIPGAIFSEAFLAYIGLGLRAPETSIGVMLSDGQKVLLQHPYQILFPAVLISILMVSFNLFSNGLRDALNPTMRGTE